jgi:hypothetical protein
LGPIPNPQSPIPNPQSPSPIPNEKEIYLKNYNYLLIKNKLKQLIIFNLFKSNGNKENEI